MITKVWPGDPLGGKLPDAEATDRIMAGMEKAGKIVEELLGAGFKGCANKDDVEHMHRHFEGIATFLPKLAEGVPAVCSALASGNLPLEEPLIVKLVEVMAVEVKGAEELGEVISVHTELRQHLVNLV